MTEDSELKSKDNFVWIDMEMTGLDPNKEVVIEIATIITDKNLNILAKGPDIVINQPESYLDNMDNWNTKQHGSTGLTEEVKKSDVTLEQAEAQTLEFIDRYCYPNSNPLCGNSVHHDRRFMIHFMPKLHEYLHYRHVDVSTVKTIINHWYPRNRNVPKKGNRHRALADIEDSIEEFRYYREFYFKPLDEIVKQIHLATEDAEAAGEV